MLEVVASTYEIKRSRDGNTLDIEGKGRGIQPRKAILEP
ncbi:hypothetical protein LCGC14_2576670 [marine sediment metagenome]|uniref:Uncharacterized protein n=1 Tax=marine sediment metagenome TaxID=412755 RepID=A0A0F9B3J3_9ZZZZ